LVSKSWVIYGRTVLNRSCFTLERGTCATSPLARHVSSAAVRCRRRTPRRACDHWFVYRALATVWNASTPLGRCHVPRAHPPASRAALRHWLPTRVHVATASPPMLRPHQRLDGHLNRLNTKLAIKWPAAPPHTRAPSSVNALLLSRRASPSTRSWSHPTTKAPPLGPPWAPALTCWPAPPLTSLYFRLRQTCYHGLATVARQRRLRLSHLHQ
jgi:hypothetical protein